MMYGVTVPYDVVGTDDARWLMFTMLAHIDRAPRVAAARVVLFSHSGWVRMVDREMALAIIDGPGDAIAQKQCIVALMELVARRPLDWSFPAPPPPVATPPHKARRRRRPPPPGDQPGLF